MCRLFHDWAPWRDAEGAKIGGVHKTVQRRYCWRCKKIQVREVFES